MYDSAATTYSPGLKPSLLRQLKPAVYQLLQQNLDIPPSKKFKKLIGFYRII
jgi:hypothetical protein